VNSQLMIVGGKTEEEKINVDMGDLEITDFKNKFLSVCYCDPTEFVMTTLLIRVPIASGSEKRRIPEVFAKRSFSIRETLGRKVMVGG
jgi:hypothetical protein